LRFFIYALFILTLLPSTSNGTIVPVPSGFTILNWSTSTINEEDVDEFASNLNPATLFPADTFSTYSDSTPESELDTVDTVEIVPAKDALFVTTLADSTLIELANEPDAFEKANAT
jgi:flagellar motor protein MotB